MRIALVHSFYSSSSPSGENLTVNDQLEALRSAGHDVLLVRRDTDAEEQRSLHSIRAGLRTATGVGHSPAKELAAFRPDVVHVHNLFPNFGTAWLESWTGPVVVTLHNYRYVCSNGLLFRSGEQCTLCPESGSIAAVQHACYRSSRLATLPLAWQTRGPAGRHPVIRRADRVVVLSSRARDLGIRFGIPVSKLTLTPNFVRQLHPVLTPAPAHARFLAVGRLTPEKGFLELLNAWPSDVGLDLIGEGPLAERISSQVGGATRYVGPVANAEWRMNSSEYSGLIFSGLVGEGAVPLTVVEAWEGSLPVIARFGSGGGDAVAETGAGVVYGNGMSLDEAITHVVAGGDRLRSVAHDEYLRHYTQESWTSRIVDIYGAAGVARHR